MDVAKIILDYLKVLIWPCIVTIIIFSFYTPIEFILNRISSRIETAHNVKFNLGGQKIELTGLGKEILKNKLDQVSQNRNMNSASKDILINDIIDILNYLSKTESDLIGSFLYLNHPNKFDINTIIFKVRGLTDDEINVVGQPPNWLVDQFEVMLNELNKYKFVTKENSEYSLTSNGLKMFSKITTNLSENRKYKTHLENMKINKDLIINKM